MSAPSAEVQPVESYPPEEAEADGSGGDEVHTRKKRRKARKLPGQDIAHLNLTPMMDIMTMLLVFLVKSFAEEPNNINVSLNLRPPPSSSEPVIEPATRVIVTKEDILVNDRVIMTVGEARNPNLKTAWLPPLRDGLLEEKDHLDAIHRLGGPEFDGALLVVADEATPYALLTSVLVTAGESQFSQYRLVVMPGSAKP
jgi:biopolymer transport protein ExbD